MIAEVIKYYPVRIFNYQIAIIEGRNEANTKDIYGLFDPAAAVYGDGLFRA